MTRTTRPISWVSSARKEFDDFPEGAKSICLAALTIAAEGGKADIVKPLKGLGTGIMEIALPYRGNAFRVVYAVQMARTFGLSMPSRRNRPKGSRRRNTRST